MWTGFSVSAFFHDQVSSVGIMNVSTAILVVCESRGLRQKLILISLITHFQQTWLLQTLL